MGLLVPIQWTVPEVYGLDGVRYLRFVSLSGKEDGGEEKRLT